MNKEIIISDRYIVKRKIGEGGMAKVYLAFDKETKQDVAVKVLKTENIDEKKIRSFRREAQTLSMLNDENIVSIIDVGEENDVYYIVNEFIEGMTLKEYISTCSPLEVEEVVNITIQILNGLNHAHQKGVVHKDIKSQNILLNAERKVKITDLGIADIIDEEFTRTQSLMGTPQYVAPEILNRDRLTIQSDIYSVGILLYEMLVGKAPFTGEKPAIIMIKQMNHPLPSIIEQRGDVPQPLENIAIRASAKKLENRYQSVEKMLADLLLVKNGKNQEPKLILENDLADDKKLEQTIVLATSNLNIEKKQPKKQKKFKIRYIIITLIVMLLMYFSWLYLKPEDLIMPNFVGEKIENVRLSEEMEEENISIIYKNSDDVAENNIIETDPKAGETLQKDQEVFITVSQGPKKIEIENYIGKNAYTVKNTLESLGYKVEISQVDSLEPKGNITNQEPAAGQLVGYKDTIVLYESTGQKNIATPNFIGLPINEIEEWSNENQIELKKVEVCNSAFAEGQVVKQSPEYKKNIQSGGTLTIDVVGANCDIKVENKSDEKQTKTEETDKSTDADKLTETDKSTESDKSSSSDTSSESDKSTENDKSSSSDTSSENDKSSESDKSTEDNKSTENDKSSESDKSTEDDKSTENDKNNEENTNKTTDNNQGVKDE